MNKEDPKSLEAQLQMARPRRSEVKRVPLTPEEKEFLGKIMEKAVAAEKAGKLHEALNFYIDYKNELSRIKEKKEDTGQRTVKKTEEIIRLLNIGLDEKFIENNFDLTKLPDLETKGDLDLSEMEIDEFPVKMTVNGNLDLGSSTIKKWNGTGLVIRGNFILSAADTDSLPEEIRVKGSVFLQNSTIQDLPDNFFIRKDINVRNCAKPVKLKAHILKISGRIKGIVKN